ncbi:type II toxin-antitoxin system RelE/ParE family toxin [Photorhabdus heterorhabditis]|uniref:Type II toxin-antitoxin system RelE/ParE family toxin n=1 Tax=Photorhabdus heterorhabditis TaxID=880156 RepID=A0A5B0WYF0_9GAMM|nr:type II toxin-antitoxin system RelE/ParE family toxin [Photorhabdus heterorhabditis]MBS9441659.1 type II toxin-antitoxin system RelE/ParE family toxin [Photorhabdus heterorhabditis]
MSSKTFFLKPKAEQDLEAIFEYSYQEFGLEKAYQYIKS